jgi:hypothetical protein
MKIIIPQRFYWGRRSYWIYYRMSCCSHTIWFIYFCFKLDKDPSFTKFRLIIYFYQFLIKNANFQGNLLKVPESTSELIWINFSWCLPIFLKMQIWYILKKQRQFTNSLRLDSTIYTLSDQLSGSDRIRSKKKSGSK